MSKGAERFGVEQKEGGERERCKKLSKVKICQLTQKLKSLRRQFKAAKEEERLARLKFTSICRVQLITFKGAKWHRKNKSKGPEIKHLPWQPVVPGVKWPSQVPA